MRPHYFLRLITTLSALVIWNFASAQKEPLDHSVYDNWKSLQGATISDEGRFAATIISPQEGDSILYLRDLKNSRTLIVKGVRRFTLSPDGQYTVGIIKTPFADRREARIKKKKANELPEDTLVMIRNSSFEMDKVVGVKSFKTPEKMASHITYTIMEKADTTKIKSDTITKKEKRGKPRQLLVIRNIATQEEEIGRAHV